MSFINVVTITTKPGKADTVIEHLKKIKKEVLEKEKGTKKYDIAQSKEKPEEIYLWEEYINSEALDIHRDGEAYKAMKSQFGELFEGLKIETCHITA